MRDGRKEGGKKEGEGGRREKERKGRKERTPSIQLLDCFPNGHHSQSWTRLKPEASSRSPT